MGAADNKSENIEKFLTLFANLKKLSKDNPASLLERAYKNEDMKRLCFDVYDIIKGIAGDLLLAKGPRSLSYDPAFIEAKADYEKNYSDSVTKIININRFIEAFKKMKQITNDPNIILDKANSDAKFKNFCYELNKYSSFMRWCFSNKIGLFMPHEYINLWREYEEKYEDVIVNFDFVLENLSNISPENPIYQIKRNYTVKQEDNWENSNDIGRISQTNLDKSINSLENISKLLLENKYVLFCDDILLLNIYKSIRPEYSHDELSLIIKYTYEIGDNDDEEKIYEKFGDAQSLKLIESEIEYRIKDGILPKDSTLGGLIIDSIDDFIKDSVEIWKDLKENCGLDVHGMVRRNEIIPPVSVPPKVAEKDGSAEKLSMLENLKQAQRAFVFGAPYAAFALLRSIVEAVLRDHYHAEGRDLNELINNARRLPDIANKYALHNLRWQANDVLHLGQKSEGNVIKKGAVQFETMNEKQREMEIVRLFTVVRALIEGVK